MNDLVSFTISGDITHSLSAVTSVAGSGGDGSLNINGTYFVETFFYVKGGGAGDSVDPGSTQNLSSVFY